MIFDDVNAGLWEALGKFIDLPAQNRVMKICAETYERVPVVIAQLGLAPDAEVVTAYSQVLGVEVVSDIEFEPVTSGALNPHFLKSRKVLPWEDETGALHLAMVDPTDEVAYQGVAFAAGEPPKRSVISLTNWRQAFQTIYGNTETDGESGEAQDHFRAGWADDATRLKDMSSEAPVIRRVEELLTRAADMGASDIHVEPAPNMTRIRFRVDGQMLSQPDEAPDMATLIASRIKVMCDMDVADTRRPQDGRTSSAVRGRPIDLRVSTVPTAYGESLVIRLLDRTASLLDLDKLGFSKTDLSLITRVLENPKGIFLVTGPTGSGKTTTLYAALNRLRQTQRKILTVEDPIEYFFDDINQVQVNEAAGVSFSSALRSFLRQDPDIMMVGEIRDEETARIAVQAALTGHLVLSTLHTNDAVSAVSRLKDMGVEDYLIAATVSGVTAQRLVRRLCPDCRAPDKASGAPSFKPVGCAKCSGEGYRGRIVISEGFRFDEKVATLVRDGASSQKLLAAAKAQGFRSMHEDGLQKAANGDVALSDVYAAIGADG